jgi:[acyl-carrier-protein] S-malonyltransferase
MKIAWLFPGQGSQKTGMGALAVEAYPAAKDVFLAADERLGFPLSQLCFNGPDSDLALTANTQPAIVTTSCALLAALREAYPSLPPASYVAGHSLGEYSALVAAGALEFSDAVALVRLRGSAMQRAVPEGQGGMLAVIGADAAAVEDLCAAAREDDVLSPANYNCPGQIVIAGHQTAISRAQTLAKERKLKAIPLKVSAPFHCALMKPAATELAEALAQVSVQPLNIPVVANLDASPYTEANLVAPKLIGQVDGAVRWEQTLQFLAEQGVTHALELGPGNVLAGLLKKTVPSISVLNVDGPDAIQKVPAFLELSPTGS